MPSGNINNLKHWRDRAVEMRALVDAMKDSETIAIMHRLVHDCDKLAYRAEQRSDGKIPPKR